MGELRAPPAAVRISLLLPSPLPSLAPAPFHFPAPGRRAGQGPLAPGRTPEARSGAGNHPSLFFPYKAFAALFNDLCPTRRGLSLPRVIRRAVQGELPPLTAAVLRCLPSLPPEAEGTGSCQRMPPSGRQWLWGETAAAGTEEKKKSKKTVSGRGGERGQVAAGAAGRSPAPFAEKTRRNTRMKNTRRMESSSRLRGAVARHPPGEPDPCQGCERGCAPAGEPGESPWYPSQRLPAPPGRRAPSASFHLGLRACTSAPGVLPARPQGSD